MNGQFVTPPVTWASRCAAFDERIFAEEAWPRAVWEHELGSEFAHYLALPQAGLAAIPEVVALGGVSRGVEAEILTLGVARSARGQGIGGKLLDRLIELAWGEGSEQIFLEVRASGHVAQSLYRSRGFEVVGERPNYYRDEDALIMRLQREYTGAS